MFQPKLDCHVLILLCEIKCEVKFKLKFSEFDLQLFLPLVKFRTGKDMVLLDRL